MNRHLLLILLYLLTAARSPAQNNAPFRCGQKDYTDALLRHDATLQRKWQEAQQQLPEWKKRLPAPVAPGARVMGTPVVLTVAVHIIHNNGAENISDAQVQTAIRHLNEAYANSGYYDPSDGVNTNIQFRLATCDPNGQPTSAITRDVSPYTVMNPADPFADDQAVKTIRQWNPFCFINIWVVKSIGPVINGYATLPFAHGQPTDGIVITAAAFGSSYANDAVIAHEMGHYLGLYHTFEGGCTNNDCSLDGDQVCDTPPTQSGMGVSCNQPVNSCSTDALSGFSIDQDDNTKNYMDYSPLQCRTMFTQGQSDRMNAFLQGKRASLLTCKFCQPPCPAPVTADFIPPVNATVAGQSYSFVNSSTGAASYEWYVNGTLVSTATNLTRSFPAIGSYTVRLVARSGNPALCADAEKTFFLSVICPPGGCKALPPASTDTCVVHTFQKNIGTPGYEFAETVNVDAGGYVITGQTAGAGTGSADVEAIRLDTAGRLLWARAYGDADINIGFDATLAPDGSTLIVGTTQSATGLASATVYRIDVQGKLLWSRNYASPFASCRGVSIVATIDGGGLVCVQATSGAIAKAAALLKIDAAGNVQWSKQYYNSYTPYPWRVTETTDGFLVTVITHQSGSGTPGFLVFSVNKQTGAVIWGMDYNIPGVSGTQAYQLLPSGDSLVLGLSFTGHDGAGMPEAHYGVLYTDRQGVPFTGAYMLDGEGGTYGGRMDMAVMAGGNVCFTYGPLHASDPQNARLAVLDPHGRLVMARRYVNPYVQGLVRIKNTADGGIVAVGNGTVGGSLQDNYILKMDSRLLLSDPLHSTTGCTVADETPVMSRPIVVATAATVPETPFTVTASDNIPVVTDFTPASYTYCDDAALCSSLRITGKDTTCVSTSDTLVYTSGRPAGCPLPVQWQADPAAARIVDATDTSVRLLMLTSGPSKLQATMQAMCHIVADSRTIHAFQSPAAVDLGGDLALCRQSTVILHAGSGFQSYRWQDGYADSTYTAWTPGLYYVIARDYCNNLYGDTITISQAPDVPFDLGPDTAICRGDTLRLSAPAGFTGYSWAPRYGLDNPYAATVSLSPDKDSLYTCTAAKGRGCQVMDSIRVTVRALPAHFLSPAGIVCNEGEAEITAAGQWSAYLWADSSTGRSMTTRAPGSFVLQVTDSNGCRGRDSIIVQPGFCHPGLWFPNAFSPDGNGHNDLFRPIVSEPIDDFYMAIYDRYGEKIFESRDPARGWDGSYRGKKFAGDTFVWYARYHVKGSAGKTTIAKGSGILLH